MTDFFKDIPAVTYVGPNSDVEYGFRHYNKDEVILDDAGNRMFVCSDSAYCGDRRVAGHAGPMAGHALDGLATSDDNTDDDAAAVGIEA